MPDQDPILKILLMLCIFHCTSLLIKSSSLKSCKSNHLETSPIQKPLFCTDKCWAHENYVQPLLWLFNYSYAVLLQKCVVEKKVEFVYHPYPYGPPPPKKTLMFKGKKKAGFWYKVANSAWFTILQYLATSQFHSSANVKDDMS